MLEAELNELLAEDNAERNMPSRGLGHDEEGKWIQTIHVVFDKESDCIQLMS